MTRSLCYALWGVLFILCGCLGFIPEPAGALAGAMTVLSVLFFLPPGLLLRRAAREGDSRTIRVIRNLAAASLALTVAVLIVNFAAVTASETVGNILYGLLAVLSVPMFCARYWMLSLFLWACLLIAAQEQLRKK